MFNVETIMEFLSKIEPILLILIPGVIVIAIKIKNKIKQESKIAKSIETHKSKEKYNAWAHDESRRVILKIKELCNVYKDRSYADQVLYMQFENGTTATSKLYNMFLSCLAEDNRYGEIPKKLPELQHIPYSQVAEWVEEIIKENEKNMFIITDIQSVKDTLNCPVLKESSSHISAIICDKNGYFIGIIVFNYKNINFNDTEKSYQINSIKNFKTAVETVFLAYCVSQQDKMKELKLSEADYENN